MGKTYKKIIIANQHPLTNKSKRTRSKIQTRVKEKRKINKDGLFQQPLTDA
jgi:hypothetical protein